MVTLFAKFYDKQHKSLDEFAKKLYSYFIFTQM